MWLVWCGVRDEVCGATQRAGHATTFGDFHIIVHFLFFFINLQ